MSSKSLVLVVHEGVTQQWELWT